MGVRVPEFIKYPMFGSGRVFVIPRTSHSRNFNSPINRISELIGYAKQLGHMMIGLVMIGFGNWVLVATFGKFLKILVVWMPSHYSSRSYSSAQRHSSDRRRSNIRRHSSTRRRSSSRRRSSTRNFWVLDRKTLKLPDPTRKNVLPAHL